MNYHEYRIAGSDNGIPPPDPIPPGDRARSVAHLSHTVLDALAHVSRHATAALEAPDGKSRQFNMEHMNRHVAEAVEHQRKLIRVLCEYHPEVGKETAKMMEISDPASDAPVPVPGKSGRSADYDVGDTGPVPA